MRCALEPIEAVIERMSDHDVTELRNFCTQILRDRAAAAWAPDTRPTPAIISDYHHRQAREANPAETRTNPAFMVIAGFGIAIFFTLLALGFVYVRNSASHTNDQEANIHATR